MPKTETFILDLSIRGKRYLIIRRSSHREHGIRKLQPSSVHTVFHYFALKSFVSLTTHTTDKDVPCSTVSNTEVKTV